MHIKKANGKKKLVISRKEWELIGKKAQWNPRTLERAQRSWDDMVPEDNEDPFVESLLDDIRGQMPWPDDMDDKIRELVESDVEKYYRRGDEPNEKYIVNDAETRIERLLEDRKEHDVESILGDVRRQISWPEDMDYEVRELVEGDVEKYIKIGKIPNKEEIVNKTVANTKKLLDERKADDDAFLGLRRF